MNTTRTSGGPAAWLRAALLLGALALGAAPAARAVSADEQMQFADGLYVRGLYDMAVKEYMALLRDVPAYPKMDLVLYRIAESYRQTGNTTAADLFYRRVAKEYPQGPARAKAEFRRAEQFVTAGQYVDAANLFALFLVSKPPAELSAASYYYIGYSLARTNRLEEAAVAFQKVMDGHADSPYAPLAALERGAQYRKAGANGDAEAALYRRAAEHKAATPEVAAEAWFQLGDLEFRRKNYPAAAAAYDRLVKDHPAHARAAEARLQIAWAYFHTRRFADALALLDAPLRDPALARADEWLYLKANAQRQLLNTADATATYQELMARFPQSPLAASAAYERALIAFQQRKYADVIAQLVPFQPDERLRPDFHWLLAESYSGAGQTNNAIQFYRLIADGAADNARAPDALYRLGRLLQDRGDRAEASGIFRRLADKYPKDEDAAPSLFASGFCLAADQHLAEAVNDWGRVARDYADCGLVEEALYQKGLAEIRIGRDAQARESLASLLKRHPKTAFEADARFWISTLLEKGQEAGLAEAELRRALQLEVKPELQRKLQYRLASVLQKQNKLDEAADLLQGLLATPLRGEMTPALLEWLARLRLERNAFAPAAAAAEALVAQQAPEPWPRIGNYLLGRARAGEGNRPAAIAALEVAVAGPTVTRESELGLVLLGELLVADGKFDDARARYQAAAERAADASLGDVKARAVHGLGGVAEAQQKWDEAARYFLSVAILYDDPKLSAECLYRAAEAFGKQAQPERRAQTLKELAERYPDSEWAKKAAAAK